MYCIVQVGDRDSPCMSPAGVERSSLHSLQSGAEKRLNPLTLQIMRLTSSQSSSTNSDNSSVCSSQVCCERFVAIFQCLQKLIRTA